MEELGTRCTTERVHVGNSPPKVARAALLPDRGRRHMTRQLIWTTNDLPVHFSEDGEDKRTRESGITSKHGAVFRGIACELGVAPATIGPRYMPRHSWGWTRTR